MTKTAALFLLLSASAQAAAETTVRTDVYPRPPYSGATYYIYERGGDVVCTKLKVCNKFNECETSYHPGRFLEAEDRETGSPFSSTPAAIIPPGRLATHVCLARFGLITGP